jgi:hypothetical protein
VIDVRVFVIHWTTNMPMQKTTPACHHMRNTGARVAAAATPVIKEGTTIRTNGVRRVMTIVSPWQWTVVSTPLTQ